MKLSYAEFEDGIQATINETDTEIYLAFVQVDKDKRCQGIGTNYIKKLIKYSLKWNKKLTLIPSDVYGSESKRLKKFYKKLGFKDESNKLGYWEYKNGSKMQTL